MLSAVSAMFLGLSFLTKMTEIENLVSAQTWKKVLCILLHFYYRKNNCKEILFFKSVKFSRPKSNCLRTFVTSSKDGSFAFILHSLPEWNHCKIIPLKIIPRSTNTENKHWIIVLSFSSGSYTLTGIIVIESFTSCFCVKSLRYLLYTNLLKRNGMVEIP